MALMAGLLGPEDAGFPKDRPLQGQSSALRACSKQHGACRKLLAFISGVVEAKNAFVMHIV
jgi:hypothetical protein